MVIKKGKPIIDTQKINKKETQCTITEKYQMTMKEQNKKEQNIKQAENNSQNGNRLYLSIITLNVNGLTSLIKRHITVE